MVDGGQVEDHQRSVEMQPVGGRSVEHATQVSVDQATEFEGHVPAVLHQHRPGGAWRRAGVRDR